MTFFRESTQPVTGKIYVCVECQKTVKVDYEGGSQQTEIGVKGITRQLEFSQRFGQPNADPYTQGFYLYDLGTCSDCYESFVSSEDREHYEQIFNLIEKVETKRELANHAIAPIAADAIRKVVSDLTLQDVGKAIGSRDDLPLAYKNATETEKRQMNKRIVRNQTYLVRSYALNKAFAEAPLKQILDQYRDDTKPLTSQLASLLGLTHGKTYTQKHTNAGGYLFEDLPNLRTWQFGLMKRYPVDDATDEIFYYPVQYDVPGLIRRLAIGPDDYELTLSIRIDKEMVGNIMEKLTLTELQH